MRQVRRGAVPSRFTVCSSPLVKLSKGKQTKKGAMAVSVPGTTEEQESLEQEKEGGNRKFLEQQYIALRNEIEQASDRAFKIFAASVLVVPTGLTLGGVAGADNTVLPLIKMLLPL